MGDRKNNNVSQDVSFDFSGRTVLITGASRGLGKSFAIEFARARARVGLIARSGDGIEELAESLPVESVGVVCDVSDLASVKIAFASVADRLGGIDVVVSNAAITDKVGLIQDFQPCTWEEVIDTNLTGAFNVAQTAYPYLSSSAAGRMVLVSSRAADCPLRGSGAYAVSKAGIEGLARVLCVDWAREDICVNVVSLGVIDNGNLLAMDQTIKDKLIDRTPLARVGLASEVASTVLFLSSASSGFVTGQVIGIDGGFGLG